eukprot:EG_transcript_60138
MPRQCFPSLSALPCTDVFGRPAPRAHKAGLALRPMNAFVNTAGGVLLFGVDADGTARGLVVDRLYQALLQRTVANIFQAFRPPVPPEAFEVGFWPLYDRATGRPTGRVV